MGRAPKAVAAATWVHIDELQPWDQNPRHNDTAAEQLKGNIAAFGFTAPIVAQLGSNRIIAGHTRQKAVRLLLADNPTWTATDAPAPGFVPVRYLDVDDATAMKLTISDNRLGDIATWDEVALAELLQSIAADGEDALEHLGFDDDELAVLLGRWTDPFYGDGDRDGDGDGDGDGDDGGAQLNDVGTSKIVIELPITKAQDASTAIRTALEQMGVKPSDYKLRVT